MKTMKLGLPGWLHNELVLTFKHAISVSLVVFLISLLVPNQYVSRSTILAKDPKAGGSGLGGLAAAAAAFGISAQVDDPGLTYIDILNSRWVAGQLLEKKYNFYEKNWLFGIPRLKSMTLEEYLDCSDRDKSILELSDCLNASRDDKSGLISVTMRTGSPDLSQMVVRDAVALLEGFVITRSQTQAGVKVLFIEQRLKEAFGAASLSEDRFRKFLYENRNYTTSPDPGVRLAGSGLEADLNLRRQVTSNLAVALEQAYISKKDDTPILNILDSGNLPIQKSFPSRATASLAFFMLAAVGSLAFRHRVWLRERLLMDRER